jgi:hypothetical protein
MRNSLGRFITAQTQFDRQAAERMQVAMGRTTMPRAIALDAVIGQGDTVKTQIDLMQAQNQLHTEDNGKISAYNIGAGMFFSELEGSALAKGTINYDYFSIWAAAPDTMKLMYVQGAGGGGAEFAQQNMDAGYPSILLDHLSNTENLFFLQDTPSVIDGEKHWAWLEIDPKTYYTIAYLDNGSRSSMAEYLMNMMPDATQMRDYLVGGFVGITTSIWAVASFSLVLDDYNDVLKNAIDFMIGLNEIVKEAISTAQDPTGKALEKLKSALPSTSVEHTENVGGTHAKVTFKFDFFTASGSMETGNDYNLLQGFEDGIAYYLTNAVNNS